MSRPIFTAITSEGGLLPADFLQTLLAPKPTVDGLKPTDYHLDPNDRLNDVIAGSWNKLRSRWQTFRSKIEGRLSGDSTTSETRELWLQPLLGELGFGRVPVVRGLSVGDRTFEISHQWDSIPLHLVGTHVDLDQRTPGATGASRGSPHSILQQLLNADPQRLWGVVSNGWQLRLLRDNAALTRQAYIEFDLQAIFDGDLYPEFVVMWLVLHQSRFELREGQLSRCWLEMWRQAADQKGLRALEHLRYGVESAIMSLGAGLLSNPLNGPLREALSSGQLTAQALYQQILRTVYRMIFLFVAEDRGLLHTRDPSEEASRARARYSAHYSLSRLRELQLSRAGTPHPDLWIVFQLVTRKLGEEGATELALPILGSFLWSADATKELNDCVISNRQFLEAVHALAFTQEEGGLKRTVDYRNLGAEELGSVYEGLLEQHVSVDPAAQSFTLDTAAGNERKTSGSYYTPDSLVQCLLDSALEPVVAEAARGKTGEVAAKALLALKICDPAVGSGHFLIAAAHRLAKRVAAARTGEEEPSPEATRSALRDVIGHCLYGVDINPMSAELCRVSLWLEALEPGKPLSFLDHHIRCGNSLLGANSELIRGGVPDNAYDPIEGDDKEACSALKKRNKRENPKLGEWFIAEEETIRDRLHQAATALDEMSDSKPEDIRRKEAAFRAAQGNQEFGEAWNLANLWCAAFVIRKRFPESAILPSERSASQQVSSTASTETQVGLFDGSDEVPRAKPEKTKATSRSRSETPIGITTQHLHALVERGELPGDLLVEAKRLADQYQFFHWHLAFPEVFARGGFDCLLGNPPWERVKLQKEEWFSAQGRADIAGAVNAAARERMIQALKKDEPTLYSRFTDALRSAEAESAFFRRSGHYPLSGTGDVNTYAIFTELATQVVGPNGIVGIIVPTGIATDDQLKEFFTTLIERSRLGSLTGFENEEFFFPGIANVVRYCAISISGTNRRTEAPQFAFYIRNADQIKQAARYFSLSSQQIRKLNPNTRTCPIFRSRFDAELTLRLYDRFPILRTDDGRHNTWKLSFLRMFDMANDSGLFLSEPNKDALPLYEAKLMWHYDHRFGSYEFKGVLKGKGGRGLPDMPLVKHQDPNYGITTQYWVGRDAVESRIAPVWNQDWLLAYRTTSSAKLERTLVAAVLPRTAVNHKAPVMLLGQDTVNQAHLFLACFNSIVLDYLARQKIGGTDVGYFHLDQLPVPPPSVFTSEDDAFIRPRVLELTYTATNVSAFAETLGWEGKPFKWVPERRFVIQCELDAYLAHLYSLKRDDWLFILDPSDIHGPAFPGESFRVLKEKENALFGTFRTKELCLQFYDALATARRECIQYQSPLDPPPGSADAAWQ